MKGFLLFFVWVPSFVDPGWIPDSADDISCLIRENSVSDSLMV